MEVNFKSLSTDTFRMKSRLHSISSFTSPPSIISPQLGSDNKHNSANKTFSDCKLYSIYKKLCLQTIATCYSHPTGKLTESLSRQFGTFV